MGRYQDVINLATQTIDSVEKPYIEESFYWRGRARGATGDVDGDIADQRTAVKYHAGFQPALDELSRLGVGTKHADCPALCRCAYRYCRSRPARPAHRPAVARARFPQRPRLYRGYRHQRTSRPGVVCRDAYKDRTPSPTYQREWGRRIIRLAQAGIPTLCSSEITICRLPPERANALQEFDTLQVPHIHVLSKPAFLGPADLENLPLQVLAIPWIFTVWPDGSPGDERQPA